MFYIFLDIDGVLNKEVDWKRPFTLNKKCVNNFLSLLDYYKKKKNSAAVVLTSSWKTGFSHEGNHASYVRELLEVLRSHGVEIAGTTSDECGANRGKAVELYIALREIGEADYVVLDDDRSLFPTSRLNIYYTDSRTGLTSDDVAGLTGDDKRHWHDIFKWE
ncbi:HAD domain-containing protein [Anaerovibrio sp. JC8]|uniref:HAD domain-containing protein n=1 Tax=Anaerovibrio sp. JC8 TaxID=1240085 RepID=UPI000A0F5C9D|nr:HAD domain-containing protein [Anaerovibrio sp. JC8]